MSYAPASLRALADYWVAKGGVNLGIVGDEAHQGRPSYHNGKDVITARGRTRETDYSIRTDRDWAGLTNAASAIDLGRLEGSLPKLYEFSKWLVSRCRMNAPGTDMIREVIYSPDGNTVLRWDRERGYASAPKPGEADDSHLYHTHVSFYRDTEAKDKVGLFRTYFEELSMFPIVTRTPFAAPVTWYVKAGTTLRGYSPTRPGEVVKEMTFSADSSARATARIGITWYDASGQITGPVPRGYPFLEVSDGVFKGLLIVEALVRLDPIPDPCAEKVTAARKTALDEARAALAKIV